MDRTLVYRRILLKLSGEALMGKGDYGIDPAVIQRIAGEIHELLEAGLEIGLVIGGGNRVVWIASPVITWVCWPP
jgi:uridylate kinase